MRTISTAICCYHHSLLWLLQRKSFFSCKLVSCLFAVALGLICQNLQAQLPAITDSVFYYRDNKNPAEFIRTITSPPSSFVKVQDRIVNFPMGKTFAYCFLKITSTQALRDQVLVIDNTSLDSVLLFKMEIKGIYNLLYEGGNALPYNRQREYVWHTAAVDLSTRPAIYLLAAKAVGQNINIKYALLSATQLKEKYLLHDRVVSIYAGAILLILLIICIAGLLIRKKFLLVYFCYVSCFAGWIFAHYGYTFPWLYPALPAINKIIKPLTNLGSCIFFLQLLQLTFSQQLKNNRQLLKMLRLLKKTLCGIAVSMLLLLLPGDHIWLTWSLMLCWHLGILFSLPLAVSIPFFYHHQNTTAKMFAIAVVVLVITGILQVTTNFGLFYNYVLNEHGMMMASLLEITTIAVGLFYNVYAENQLKESRVLQLEMQQSDTLKKLLTIQDTEQKRIANDLHDNIGPLLASLKINFGRILFASEVNNQQELVAKTEAIIDEAIMEIRNIAHDLMPKGLASKGLIVSLSDYTISIAKIYHKNVLFSHSIKNVIPPEHQLHIYRIVCELVLNAAKHSAGNSIELSLFDNSGGLQIMIFDNGNGFSEEQQMEKSFGLKSTRSRISYLQGTLVLESRPDKGTRITLDIPSALEKAHVHSF